MSDAEQKKDVTEFRRIADEINAMRPELHRLQNEISESRRILGRKPEEPDPLMADVGSPADKIARALRAKRRLREL